jgi:hypothetical protein
MQATIKELFENKQTKEKQWNQCSLCGPCQGYTARNPTPEDLLACVEAGSPKRELSAWGYNCTTLFLGDINTEA